MTKSVCLLILLLFLFLPDRSVAQLTPDFKVTHFTTEDGLPHNIIYQLMQDQDGYLWIGTDNGLVRHDGSRFEIFNSDQGLKNNFAIDIEELADGRKLIATWGEGLHLLEDDTIKKVSVPLDNFHNSETQHYNLKINDIQIGENIIVASNYGIFHVFAYPDFKNIFDPHDENFRNIYPFEKTGMIVQISEGNQINWFGGEKGIITFDYKQKKFFKKNIFKDEYIYNIQPTKNNGTFVGGDGKIFHIQKDSTIVTYQEGFPKTRIWKIQPYNDSTLFFIDAFNSLERRSLFYYDFKNNKIENLSKKYSLEGIIAYPFLDNQNNLWVGTDGDGIYKLSEKKRDEYFKTILNNEFIYSIAKDSSSYTYISTKTGLYISNSKTTIKIDESKYNSTDLKTLKYSPFHKKIIIPGLMGQFLKEGKITPFDSTKLRPDSFNDIFYLNNSNELITVYDYYLRTYRVTDQKIELLKNLNLENLKAKEIHPFNDSLFLIPSLAGLLKFNLDTVSTFLNEQNGLPSNLVNSLAISEDKKTLWLGTEKGLVKWTNSQCTVYKIEDGLPTNQCEKLLLDHLGMLWIGTSVGLVRFDGNNFFHFTSRSGLPSNSITSLYESPDHLLWVSTIKGLATVNTNTDFQKSPPTLLVNGFLINEKKIKYRPEIEIGNSSSLKIDLSIIDLNQTSDLILQYQLNNNVWEPLQNRILEYPSLGQGRYTLKFRAKNPYSNWTKPLLLTFKVNPPLWASWWAILGYAFSSVLLAVGYIKWRSAKLEKEKQKLEKIVEKRTLELAQKTEKLEKQTQQLELQAIQLKELDQSKTRFFTNISHEFRTPLSLIISPIDDLILHEERPDKQARLNKIKSNAEALLNLINQLLDISKLEAHKLRLNESVGNLSDHIRKLVSPFELLAEQKSVRFSFENRLLQPIFRYDADIIEKCVNNLISNAFKFTPVGGAITISCHQKEGGVTISVKDTGIGIQPDKINKIFDRFYQADSSETREYEGTGIGLSLVQELVSLHKGTIEVQSEKGKGSRFSIHFPLIAIKNVNEHVHQVELISQEPKQTSEGKEEIQNPEIPQVVKNKIQFPAGTTLMIVEDNAQLREYISEELTPFARVFVCKNGLEGLEMAKKTIPDLIISDVMMPKLDGFSMVKQIRSNLPTSHIPVIFLTAKASLESRIEGLRLGAEDYLPKPFNIFELQLRINNILQSRKALQEKFQKNVFIQPEEITNNKADSKFLSDSEHLIKNWLPDEIDVATFCKEIGMSDSNAFRKIKQITGLSTTQYIRSIKLKVAASLLREGFSVEEAAHQSGFSNSSYFSKSFKQQFGMVPSKYK